MLYYLKANIIVSGLPLSKYFNYLQNLSSDLISTVLFCVLAPAYFFISPAATTFSARSAHSPQLRDPQRTMLDSTQLHLHIMLCLLAQSCPPLWDPMDCSPLGSFVHEDSPSKNTGLGCHAFLQGIFPTQGWKPGLLCCGLILYHLSHQGSPNTHTVSPL